MRCKFCFATFQDVKKSILPKGHLPRHEAIEVVLQLADIGFEKITFAGGEPTLCPWLPELITTAKEAGLTTMIVTNGTNLTERFLAANRQHLDWIALSVDSMKVETNLSIGRAVVGKRPITKDQYFSLADTIKEHGYGFKVNTVVNLSNYTENLNEFIKYSSPKRWKVFQALPVSGQNDRFTGHFEITNQQFHLFIERHQELQAHTIIVSESNDDMKGSYAMVDPAGRFYDNTGGKYNYSSPILEIGSRLAIQQVTYDFGKFVRRQGVYDWTTI
jgi:radical S-adenosyl methionine domain-containing protein 2